jgi:hypothetical protein
VIELDGSLTPPGGLAILARDFQARIVNCSPSGCLLETNTRLEVGTIGRLRFIIDGRELADDVQIVRCQSIEGAGSLYQVGVRFLLTEPSRKGTLRLAFLGKNVHADTPEPRVVG